MSRYTHRCSVGGPGFHAYPHFPKVPCLCERPLKKSEKQQRTRKAHPPTSACWYLLCKLPIGALLCNLRYRFLSIKKIRVDQIISFFFFFSFSECDTPWKNVKITGITVFEITVRPLIFNHLKVSVEILWTWEGVVSSALMYAGGTMLQFSSFKLISCDSLSPYPRPCCSLGCSQYLSSLV